MDTSPSIGGLPLISCIMPTQRRPDFVLQAIAAFRRQDYPARELIIVCGEYADLPGAIDDPAIRIVHSAEPSIGGLRNAAVVAARGGIVVHWDDDDWHGPHRLSRQAAPIVADKADVTGLNDTLFLALASGEYWAASAQLYARLFVENIAGGSMMYRRALWDEVGPYPRISLREDAEWLERAVKGGARLTRLSGREDYIYVRHGRNTWKFAEGRYLEPASWMRIPEPAFLGEDRDFYLSRARATLPAAPKAPVLVSCIMPTHNRRAFLPGAIAQFLRQDHGNRELIVIDDGEDRVADLIPDTPSIVYRRIEEPCTIGAKRNLACELARGPLIAHWDDDDWRSPRWLSSQLETLDEGGADLCGLDRLFYYDPGRRSAWRYVYEGGRPWVAGGTLCYTRELWQRGPFVEVSHGEDNAFVWSAVDKCLAVNRHSDLYVAVIHPGNTSPKITTHRCWRRLETPFVERLMRADPAVRPRSRSGS
jgi:glycosyltransferase involved in cell wall biosynthesis